ncbi:MAG: rubrerythrin [Coriobacteriia bacterium]|nr:rubrerythrin [Coriobacteriia bacterium]
MPEFGSFLPGMNAERRLTHDELVRAIRYFVAAEYEAVQLYMQIADSIDDERAIKVLADVSDEERVHAGEFLQLLYALEPSEKELYRRGADEVDELLAGG